MGPGLNRPFPSASVLKRVYVRNHSNENEFDLHENERVGGTRSFHMNGRSDTEAKGN